MHAGALNVLHDAGDQNVLTIADCIHLGLRSLQVLVNQNRVLLGIPVDDRHKLLDLFVRESNLHALSSQNVAGTNQNRIAQTVCHFLCLFRRVDRSTGCTFNLALLKDLIKNLTVLGSIHILCIGSENRNPHLRQAHRQLNGCLSAELHDRIIRMLDVYDVLHILRRQRLKVQLVRDVKVSGDRLRIVIDDNGLIPFAGKGPGCMHGAVIKFNTLADTNRSGAQNQNLLAVGNALLRLIRIRRVVDRIEIRCLCFKLCRAGIYHLVARRNAVVVAKLCNLLLCFAGPAGNNGIRKLHALRLRQKLSR